MTALSDAAATMTAAMRQAVPAEAIALIDDIVAELAAALGESPEAWRGAALTAAVLGAALGIGDIDAERRVMGALTCIARIGGHPAALAALGRKDQP